MQEEQGKTAKGKQSTEHSKIQKSFQQSQAE
jgi:hypothetical protein